jgi:hypothetical protein
MNNPADHDRTHQEAKLSAKSAVWGGTEWNFLVLPPFTEANKSRFLSERYLIAKTGRLTFLSRGAYAKLGGLLLCPLI